MRRFYYSLDVETSGPAPGRFSMLSFGLCAAENTKVNIYRELKPIGKRFDIEAMKVSSLGLRCLDDLKHLPEYNPKHRKFRPDLVLKVLEEKGMNPRKAMRDTKDFLASSTPKGYRPVLAAAPIIYDGMFFFYYLDNFLDGPNPLGYSGVDMSSMYKGAVKDLKANFHPKNMPHNALEDAIIQAEEFQKVLKIIRG